MEDNYLTFTNDNKIPSTKFTEYNDSSRFTRFTNALINYDYKTGNYIGNWEKQYPFLVTSFIEVARGIRKPS